MRNFAAGIDSEGRRKIHAGAFSLRKMWSKGIVQAGAYSKDVVGACLFYFK